MWKSRDPERATVAGAKKPPPPACSWKAIPFPTPQNFRERPDGSPRTSPTLIPDDGVVVSAETRSASMLLF